MLCYFPACFEYSPCFFWLGHPNNIESRRSRIALCFSFVVVLFLFYAAINSFPLIRHFILALFLWWNFLFLLLKYIQKVFPIHSAKLSVFSCYVTRITCGGGAGSFGRKKSKTTSCFFLVLFAFFLFVSTETKMACDNTIKKTGLSYMHIYTDHKIMSFPHTHQRTVWQL